VIGRRYWIWIWYGILALGVVGLIVALDWARKTGWKNLDEILRAIGTIAVSIGMILLLEQIGGGVAYTLFIAALLAFVLAFVLGRRPEDERPGYRDEEDDDA
jgi:hypothetical protein